MDSHAADSAPAALTDLIAAGLVSHEVIGDPARLGAEAATLEVLCRLIAGPVWRIGAFHYAFRAQPGDLGGRLAELAPADWTVALEAALQAELGPDVVWASPVDLLAAAEADLDQPLLLLRAQADAVSRALVAAPAGTRAVVQAGYAAEVARLTAGADAGGALDRRLAAIEIRQDRILEMLAARAEGDRALARLDLPWPKPWPRRSRACSAGSTPRTRCSRRSAAGSSAWPRPPATRAPSRRRSA